MVITPYKNVNKKTKAETLFYRVKLNNSDLEKLKSTDTLFYQLKCIVMSPKVHELIQYLKTDNLSFSDRIVPNDYTQNTEKEKTTFEILLNHKLRKRFNIVLKIEFRNDGFLFRDVFVSNNVGVAQDKFVLSRIEYQLATELEKIYDRLFEIPKKINLCKECKYYSEYLSNGYCLKYYPDNSRKIF